jgi:hypothetical protein
MDWSAVLESEGLSFFTATSTLFGRFLCVSSLGLCSRWSAPDVDCSGAVVLQTYVRHPLYWNCGRSSRFISGEWKYHVPSAGGTACEDSRAKVRAIASDNTFQQGVACYSFPSPLWHPVRYDVGFCSICANSFADSFPLEMRGYWLSALHYHVGYYSAIIMRFHCRKPAIDSDGMPDGTFEVIWLS